MTVERSTQMGANRTGIDASPIDSKAMMEATEQFFKTHGSEKELQALKRDYVSDSGTIGSVPIPGTPKGMVKSAMKKLTGKNPEVFINKLGERLAYERSGVRTYDSFIQKCAAAHNGKSASDVPLDRLKEFRDQEAEHFFMIKHCMETLGADPTAQTPDADVSGVASLGLMKVINDPRTTVSQCLEAMLSLEMTDNAAWDLLIKLAEDAGMDGMADQFTVALEQEDVHLHEIRQWYEAAVRKQV
jgi:ferritin-like metal-binding protein YciE